MSFYCICQYIFCSCMLLGCNRKDVVLSFLSATFYCYFFMPQLLLYLLVYTKGVQSSSHSIVQSDAIEVTALKDDLV